MGVIQSRQAGWRCAIFRPTLILTRPRVQSEAFAESFRTVFGADWPVVISPLTDIVFRCADLPLNGCEAVVFTSANAVAGLVRISDRRDLPALCVGARTAEVARAAGFDAREGPGDAAALAHWIARDLQPVRVAYPRGATIAFDLEAALSLAGIETVSAILYEQAARPASEELRSRLQGDIPLLLPLFSTESARRAVAELEAATAPLYVAAMSARVADVARALRPASLEVAARPDAEAMMDALGALIDAAGSS